jgi:two-component system, NarL family, nitrate/nitrite response regulator NarL
MTGATNYPPRHITRVLILADDPLARAGLVALLTDAPQLSVAGQSASDTDLTALLPVFQPDAILWDLGWSPDNQVATLSQFVEDHTLPVVALLAVAALAEAVRTTGARGLLPRTSDGGQMAAALHAVTQGLLVFDETLLPAPTPGLPVVELVEPLSSRELEVLRYLAEGLSNKEIARKMAISENTIKFHVNAILGKLGAQSRTEAVVRATRAGLVML